MGTDTIEIKINSENDEAPTRSKLDHKGNLVRDNSTHPPCFSSRLTSALCPHHIPLPSFISYLQVRQNFRTFELLLANKAFPKLSCHLTPFSIAAPGEHPALPSRPHSPATLQGLLQPSSSLEPVSFRDTIRMLTFSIETELRARRTTGYALHYTGTGARPGPTDAP